MSLFRKNIKRKFTDVSGTIIPNRSLVVKINKLSLDVLLLLGLIVLNIILSLVILG